MGLEVDKEGIKQFFIDSGITAPEDFDFESFAYNLRDEIMDIEDSDEDDSLIEDPTEYSRFVFDKMAQNATGMNKQGQLANKNVSYSREDPYTKVSKSPNCTPPNFEKEEFPITRPGDEETEVFEIILDNNTMIEGSIYNKGTKLLWRK